MSWAKPHEWWRIWIINAAKTAEEKENENTWIYKLNPGTVLWLLENGCKLVWRSMWEIWKLLCLVDDEDKVQAVLKEKDNL